MLWSLGTDQPLCHRCADLYGLGSILYELAVGQGITGVALFSRSATIQGDEQLLPDEQRILQYREIGTTKSDHGLNPRTKLARHSIPIAIRKLTLDLIAQLCDPDPMARLPRSAIGKRHHVPGDLQWLIRRVDILIKTLANSEAQFRREARKKAK